MKKKLFFPLFYIVVILMFAAGCSSAPAQESPISSETLVATQAATVTEAPPATLAPTPTETPAPTEIPEPIACNIAFDSNRDGNLEVYRMAPDGSDLVKLTNNELDDFDPSWSPDGSQIAFVSNRVTEVSSGQHIYVMDADGGNVRQLSIETESQWPDWSPDGEWITYTNQGDIYIIPADGSGESINLTNSPEQQDEQSTWSPDSSQIAWLSGNDGNFSLFVMDADGGNVQQVTENGRVYDVTWTIDERLFTHWEQPEGICFNCVVNADGSDPIDAGGKGTIQLYIPFWTLDGDRVECVSADLNGQMPEIYLVSEIYTDIFLNLTNNPADDRNPDWPANCLLNRETP